MSRRESFFDAAMALLIFGFALLLRYSLAWRIPVAPDEMIELRAAARPMADLFRYSNAGALIPDLGIWLIAHLGGTELWIFRLPGILASSLTPLLLLLWLRREGFNRAEAALGALFIAGSFFEMYEAAKIRSYGPLLLLPMLALWLTPPRNHRVGPVRSVALLAVAATMPHVHLFTISIAPLIVWRLWSGGDAGQPGRKRLAAAFAATLALSLAYSLAKVMWVQALVGGGTDGVIPSRPPGSGSLAGHLWNTARLLAGGDIAATVVVLAAAFGGFLSDRRRFRGIAVWVLTHVVLVTGVALVSDTVLTARWHLPVLLGFAILGVEAIDRLRRVATVATVPVRWLALTIVATIVVTWVVLPGLIRRQAVQSFAYPLDSPIEWKALQPFVGVPADTLLVIDPKGWTRSAGYLEAVGNVSGVRSASKILSPAARNLLDNWFGPPYPQWFASPPHGWLAQATEPSDSPRIAYLPEVPRAAPERGRLVVAVPFVTPSRWADVNILKWWTPQDEAFAATVRKMFGRLESAGFNVAEAEGLLIYTAPFADAAERSARLSVVAGLAAADPFRP